jgi:hypothetical protein
MHQNMHQTLWRLRAGRVIHGGFMPNLLNLIVLLWCREGGRTPTGRSPADFESPFPSLKP